VTSVGTGRDLTWWPPITTSGTISVNPAQVQSRVTGTCVPAVRFELSIRPDGDLQSVGSGP